MVYDDDDWTNKTNKILEEVYFFMLKMLLNEFKIEEFLK